MEIGTPAQKDEYQDSILNIPKSTASVEGYYCHAAQQIACYLRFDYA